MLIKLSLINLKNNKIIDKFNIFMGLKPKNYFKDSVNNINYYDWHYYKKFWFTDFVNANFPNRKKEINFFGVLGNGRFIKNNFNGIKIFFSGENLDKKRTKWNFLFGDYKIEYSDLSMGFADFNSSKYMRFPLWLLYLFPGDVNYNMIKNTIDNMNNEVNQKYEMCALIAGHDKHKTRKTIYEELNNLFEIKCAGRWNNNTKELWEIYNDDKINYLKKFKFNICPENINTKNYVTEKIFEAIQADCIPIYYGSNNNPEPEILNKDRIIFWNFNSDNSKNKKMISELANDEKAYQDFARQPKFTKAAPNIINDYFIKLRSRLDSLL